MPISLDCQHRRLTHPRLIVALCVAIVVTAPLVAASGPPTSDSPTLVRSVRAALSQTARRAPSVPTIALPRVTLVASDDVARTFVRPRVPLQSKAPLFAKATSSSTFIVTYVGFSPQAQAAFQAAVDVWSQLLVSSVPIRVEAVWEDLGSPYILGSAGPADWKYNFSGSISSTWYPIALAEAMVGSTLNGTAFDISASLNSARSDWYFGTDGNTPAGKYDLMSVALHELGHGLGFIGLMQVDDGTGASECDGTSGHGCWGFGTGWPAVFDRFTEDDLGYALLNTGVFPQNSYALGNALESGDVFFDGAAARAANAANSPELYAPGSWESGSSYSHLDEGVFGPGDTNSLMTPRLASAEAVHDPGEITLGIFQDMGWEVITSMFSDGFELGNTDAWSSTVPVP